MNKRFKVSIIIPMFNSENTIRRCIDSVLRQDYDEFELIIIDDGSRDNSVRIVQSIEDERIKIFARKHIGVSAARNFGIKKSTGNYIMFLDSDDALAKNALSSLIQIVSGKGNEVIKFGYNTVLNGKKDKKSMYELPGKKIDPSKEKDYTMLIDNFYRNKNVIPCFSVTLFLPKEFLTKNKLYFDETKYIMEDAIFYLDLFESDVEIYFYDKALYDVYINNSSVTRSGGNDSVRMVVGATDSANVILSRIGYDGESCFKYLTIMTGFMAKYMNSTGKIDKRFFSDDIKKIAESTNVKNKNIFWKLIRVAILHDREYLLLLLLGVQNFRRRIKNEN